jgi:predicted Holliday junction resolvase-like endonuclease
MIVWDDVEDAHAVTVVLLNIKTGRATVNTRQRRIREAVQAGRVRFEVAAFRPEQSAEVPQLTASSQA